jgi:hypothetical protein
MLRITELYQAIGPITKAKHDAEEAEKKKDDVVDAEVKEAEATS